MTVGNEGSQSHTRPTLWCQTDCPLVTMSSPPQIRTGDIELLFRALKQPQLGEDGYDGSDAYVKTLPKGHRKTETSKPFEVDTIWEKDVNIPLRDGTILKGDIFRPASEDLVPAIIPWSPYGKTGRGQLV